LVTCNYALAGMRGKQIKRCRGSGNGVRERGALWLEGRALGGRNAERVRVRGGRGEQRGGPLWIPARRKIPGP